MDMTLVFQAEDHKLGPSVQLFDHITVPFVAFLARFTYDPAGHIRIRFPQLTGIYNWPALKQCPVKQIRKTVIVPPKLFKCNIIFLLQIISPLSRLSRTGCLGEYIFFLHISMYMQHS